VEGQQYGIHCRCPVVAGDLTPPTPSGGTPLPGEEILLDENEVAGDHAFFSLGAFDVSPDGHLLAYSTDFVGDERYTLRIKDLRTGRTLADEVPDTSYGTAWSADGSTLFYLTVDEAWRPYRVWRHAVGTPASEDVLLLEEPDERFWVGVGLTRSERYVLIEMRSKLTTEVRVIDAADPTAEPWVFGHGRREGVELTVDHQGDRFLVLHNDGAENFTLDAVPITDTTAATPLIEHRADTRLMDVDAFAGHVVVHFRRDGITGLRVLTGDGQAREIAFDEPLYAVQPGDTPDYHAGQYRFVYVSMITPDSVYDYDVATGERTLRKQRPVLGGYDPSRYEQHREWAVAPDGERVPISLFCRAGTPRNSSAPAVLYGYGSYEISVDPFFSIPTLSLVDRGFVFAIAHVRGGGELGRRWYDDGKMLRKKNTFTDFVTCARHLVERGWTSAERTVARGGSAGGLLMGAAANLSPEAFGGIVAEVPFVDALNSILDPSLPLTVTEWEEWGDPLHDPEVYAYMRSYSPYENVDARRYPPILALGGLNDTRVLYHEPAKWVARLRATADGDVLLKTEMGAGHGGPSGRYDAWKERAFANAWIIDTVAAPHDPL
ncbi:MAG TPA: S9 family peptidase, partial [Cryptosporangiaceae bacterium]|nr:S9 family peptidase [Cryptosporangiaceae bacterium]